MAQSAPTVLYLTRYYRPAAAAAGIRAERFINALRDRGLRVIVATVGDYPELTEIDSSLIVCRITADSRTPDRINIHSTSPWPRFNSLPHPAPDTNCSKTIYRVAQRLINYYPPDLIFTTGLPFGWVAVGVQLAQLAQLPLIAEFRDAWHTGIIWPYPSRMHRRCAQKWERLCLESADKIITETQTQKKILDNAYPQHAQKTVTIRHSYDPSIAPTLSDQQNTNSPHPQTFTLAYVGQLRGLDLVDVPLPKRLLRTANHLIRKTILGASFCENLRLDWMSPHYLMQAFARLTEEYPDLSGKLKLTFVGQQLPQIDRWAQKLNLAHQVRQLGPLPPHQAQYIIQNADLLILNLYGIKNLDYHWCVPGKTYTYLGSGKPILALLPSGEARDLVTRAGVGFVAQPDDVSAITRQLDQLIRQHQNGGIQLNPDYEFIRQFALPVQQRQFADLITSVIKSPPQNQQKSEPVPCAV